MQNICHPAIVSFFLNFICIIDDFLIHCKMHDVVSVKFKWVLIQYTMLNCSPNLFIVILRVQPTSSKKNASYDFKFNFLFKRKCARKSRLFHSCSFAFSKQKHCIFIWKMTTKSRRKKNGILWIEWIHGQIKRSHAITLF